MTSKTKSKRCQPDHHIKQESTRETIREPEVAATFERAVCRSRPIDSLPELLTPEEFRAYAGIGRSTMYDLLRRDEIPHIRFGRCIRIPKAALVPTTVGVK